MQVIQRANDTEYGLAASVWTNNLDSMQALTRGIKAGTVWVSAPPLNFPFPRTGMIKCSHRRTLVLGVPAV